MTQIAKIPQILITGATGAVGSEVVKQLSARGISIKAMVRSVIGAAPIASLKGVELVEGDFDHPDSLLKCLRGIDIAFLLTNSSENAEKQQLAFVKAASQSGVKHIVKLSQFAASEDSPVRFLRYHAVVEKAILESGMAYTFLRPNLFMQGILGFKDHISRRSTFFASAGDARISWVDVRDIASVAVESLISDKHQNKIYDITGPESLSHHDVAEYLSKALKRPIQYVNVAPDVMRSALISVGFPIWQADGLIEDYEHYARGEAEIVSDVVEKVTGKYPIDFQSFAADHIGFF